MKISVLIYFIFCIIYQVFAQEDNTYVLFRNPKISIKDSIKFETIDKYHPYLFSSLSLQERDSLTRIIENRKKEYSTDSVSVTEFFRLWNPYIMRLHYEDPHHRVIPLLEITNKRFKESKLQVLPLKVLLINDTVVVAKSLDNNIFKGDRIISINNVSIENYIEYYYKDRYVPFFVLQQYYHFNYTSEYSLEIERNKKRILIETKGISYTDASLLLEKDDWECVIFDDYQTGYISLKRFYRNNSLLISKLSHFIKKIQKLGYRNIIIDIRENLGGNGDRFNHLISLFTSQDSIGYMKNQEIRVSKYVLKDYDFLKEDMLGEVISMPDKYINKVIPLSAKKYLGEMNYYVLVSRNTGSIAASFANILQYNNLAKLVGEPLQHNSLKYGETQPFAWESKLNVEILSTMRFEEYTKSPDGQIYPDIEIPYIASEYMQGGDPILEKLIKYIQKQPHQFYGHENEKIYKN